MKKLTFNKKDVLKQAALVLGNSENLMTDVMEFYSEVTKVLVAKRRKDEAAQKKLLKKMQKAGIVTFSHEQGSNNGEIDNL
jgi:hypothetical protein